MGRSVLRICFAVSTVIVMCVVVLWAAPLRAMEADEVKSSRGLEVGEVFAPRISITMDGERISLPADEGLTVLVFWATWSSHSGAALALWKKFQNDYSRYHLTVIAVNADHQETTQATLAGIRTFIEERDVGLPVVIDRRLEFFNEIGVIVLPTALFLDADGKILYRLPSFPTSAALDLKEELEVRLGLVPKPEDKQAERLARYKPKNNANLFYNLAMNLKRLGFWLKARHRLIISIKRDPAYHKPVDALEKDFFKNGRTPEAERSLREFLLENGLDKLASRYGGENGTGESEIKDAETADADAGSTNPENK